MGYCMSQNESKFHIKASDKNLALRAIKALMPTKKGSFDWVDIATVKSSKNLADAINTDITPHLWTSVYLQVARVPKTVGSFQHRLRECGARSIINAHGLEAAAGAPMH